jgi:hypothetical protein
VTVTCKPRGRRKVVCKVRGAKASRSARLVRGGQVLARGTISRGQVTLRTRRTLAKGRYVVVTGATRSSLRLR